MRVQIRVVRNFHDVGADKWRPARGSSALRTFIAVDYQLCRARYYGSMKLGRAPSFQSTKTSSSTLAGRKRK